MTQAIGEIGNKNLQTMKKYLSLIAFFAVAAIACNKVDEPQISDQENELVANTNLVSFSVNLPDFVNTDTKASISDAGAFSWAENDAIFVLCCKEDDNTFHQVPFVYNTTNGKFECSFPASVTYPGGSSTITINGITRVATPEEATADGRPIAVYPDPLALVTEPTYSNAQKFFKMEGSLNSTTGEIDFEHKSALVNVHIANVPSFASYFTVSGGTELVTVHFSGETPAEVNKTVPITPTGSASDIIITLYDTADNVIISKRKSGKTLVAGHLYDTPQIKVGRVLKFTCEDTSWTGQAVHVWEVGGSGVYDFKSTSAESSAEYPWKLNELSTGVFYAVLNSVTNLTWATEGVGIGVQFKHGSESSQTDSFYLYRDGDFTLPSAGGIKTAYRAYASFTDSQWGYWIAKGTTKVMFRRAYGSQPSPSAGDTECTEVTVSSGKLFYYEFPVSEYAYDNVYWGFYNDKDTGWKGEWDDAIINRDFIKIM